MRRLTSLSAGDATRRPHYIHGPGVKKDDLLQRLGECEDAIQRITDAVQGGHNDVRTVAMVKDALFTLDQQITKERMQK